MALLVSIPGFHGHDRVTPKPHLGKHTHTHHVDVPPATAQTSLNV